jgi:glyoxylase-like metal-dependent hydrolase (beta-lactamase superfamily II)/rhodanese-related sulfurtransferase
MEIKQWENKNLSHFSYAVLSDCEKKIALIDPSRDPAPYLQFAKDKSAQIVAIIETHPHADFISGHRELRDLTGAFIYTSRLVNAQYPHHTFDAGDTLQLGKVKLSAINTPGHSADSISVLLEHDGRQHAVFTGDTLFIGDCGRPDLREGAGHIKMNRTDQAKQMYYSLRERLMVLNDDVIVYPAHGAGTLCGKSLANAQSSTIAEEKKTNWSLQDMTENEFISKLLTDQPFIPAYFPFDVEINRQGAASFKKNTSRIHYGGTVSRRENLPAFSKDALIVDVRKQSDFKHDHLSGSLNIMEDGKFETWLGSVVRPNEPFYIVGENESQVRRTIDRCADIGYEAQILGAYTLAKGEETSPSFDLTEFINSPERYTIVDVRNPSEVKANKIFSHSINIPLTEIRRRVNEIPADKPVIVHCAGGYRSAAGSSIVAAHFKGKQKVYDMSEAIKKFEHNDALISS